MEAFRFKQFSVNHEDAAFKVGTDSVLLGAWVRGEGIDRILDIGTGSGLLALMMAQRFGNAEIDAVEIDEASALEAKLNFEQSRWSERLHLIHADFATYKVDNPYELIVSNPPFFQNDLLSGDARKDQARHGQQLPLEMLIQRSAEILSENGKLSLVMPADLLPRIEALLPAKGLAINRLCKVFPKPTKDWNRVLLEISRNAGRNEIEELTIRDQQGDYSPDYKKLTAEFYPAF
jgi:tRNA1Val (adenine37-N6)-methyltransferase